MPFDENNIIQDILQRSKTSGVHTLSLSFTNLYVGMKSKPLTIVVGPRGSGKIAAVQNLAKALMIDDPLRCQMMVGHAWWVTRGEGINSYIDTQNHWNSTKILDLIQQAALPENAHRVYLACLTRISPAELNEFFSEVAFQLQHGEVIRVSCAHLTEPLPFPKNMFLLGTMDTDQFQWMNEDLMSKTSLVRWSMDCNAPADFVTKNNYFSNPEQTFIKSCIRNFNAALYRLHMLLSRQHEAFLPLFETIKTLQKHKFQISESAIQAAMVYIANSWSLNGLGLFNPNIRMNLNIAMDYAIAQNLLLPVQDKIIDERRLRERLQQVFREQFPRSMTLIGSFA